MKRITSKELNFLDWYGTMKTALYLFPWLEWKIVVVLNDIDHLADRAKAHSFEGLLTLFNVEGLLRTYI